MEEKIIFHIYNRGVEKRDIFLDRKDYERFVLSLEILNTKRSVSVRDEIDYRQALSGKPRQRLSVFDEPLVKIIAYCLMPNHFHLLLEEQEAGSAGVFMKKLTMGYSKYFNIKYARSGVLFQGRNKYKEILDDESLLHVAAYIHANPITAGLVKNPTDWPWSNYQQLITELGNGQHTLINVDPQPYQEYVQDITSLQKDLKQADLEID